MMKMAFSGTTGGGGFGRWAFCSGGRLRWGLSLLLPSTMNFFAPWFLSSLMSWIGYNAFCNERVVVIVVSNLSYRWSIKLKR
jgi:hypothetical protein